MPLTMEHHDAAVDTTPIPGPAGVGHGLVPKPLYSQVRDLLASQISAGQWAPGKTLPNESILARTFGVSIGTIRRAVEGLEDLGIVVRRQGRGTFVAGLGLPAIADKLCRVRDPRGAVLTTTSKALAKSRRVCLPVEARQLRLGLQHEVLEIRSAVLIDDTVIGVEQSVLPALLCAQLESGLARGGTLYAVLGAHGVMVTRAEESVTVTAAEEHDAQALSVAKGQPLLHVDRRAFAIDDRLVELRTSLYLPWRVCYVATTG